jgi:hypothetical protein
MMLMMFLGSQMTLMEILNDKYPMLSLANKMDSTKDYTAKREIRIEETRRLEGFQAPVQALHLYVLPERKAHPAASDDVVLAMHLDGQPAQTRSLVYHKLTPAIPHRVPGLRQSGEPRSKKSPQRPRNLI